MRKAPLTSVKGDDLSKYLRLAEKEAIVITASSAGAAQAGAMAEGQFLRGAGTPGGVAPCGAV